MRPITPITFAFITQVLAEYRCNEKKAEAIKDKDLKKIILDESLRECHAKLALLDISIRLTDGFQYRCQIDAWLASLTPFYTKKKIRLVVPDDPAPSGKKRWYVWRSLIPKDYTDKVMIITRNWGVSPEPVSVVEYCQSECPDNLSEGAPE
jgi:hypothetical protein